MIVQVTRIFALSRLWGCGARFVSAGRMRESGKKKQISPSNFLKTLWFAWKVNDWWRLYIWRALFLPSTWLNAGIFVSDRAFTIYPREHGMKKKLNMSPPEWLISRVPFFFITLPGLPRACACSEPCVQVRLNGSLTDLVIDSDRSVCLRPYPTFSGSASPSRWLMETWPPITSAHPSQQVREPRGLMGIKKWKAERGSLKAVS